MYAITISQEARFRQIAILNRLATDVEIAKMTDREVQKLVFEHYEPVLVEKPMEDNNGMRKDFYLIPKEEFKKWAVMMKTDGERG